MKPQNDTLGPLAPCPCGHGLLELAENMLGDWYSVTCGACGRTTGERESRVECTRVWNRRNMEECE